MDDTSKSRIEAAVNRLKEAIKTDNIQEIKSASEALNQVWSEVSTRLYQQTGGAQAGPQPGAASGTGEKVEEADYEVVDENKNKTKN